MNLYHSIGSIIQRYCMLSSAQGNVKTVLLLPWLQSVEVCLRSDHSLSPLWRDHDICVQADVHDPVSSIPGPWTLPWDPGLPSPRLPLLPAGQTRISGDVLKDILNYSLNWNIFNYIFNCNIFCHISILSCLDIRPATTSCWATWGTPTWRDGLETTQTQTFPSPLCQESRTVPQSPSSLRGTKPSDGCRLTARWLETFTPRGDAVRYRL